MFKSSIFPNGGNGLYSITLEPNFYDQNVLKTAHFRPEDQLMILYVGFKGILCPLVAFNR